MTTDTRTLIERIFAQPDGSAPEQISLSDEFTELKDLLDTKVNYESV